MDAYGVSFRRKLYHRKDLSGLEVPRSHGESRRQYHEQPVHDDGVLVVCHLFCWVGPEDVPRDGWSEKERERLTACSAIRLASSMIRHLGSTLTI